MGILISIGMLGASLMMAAGNSIFHQTFVQELRRRVPSVNPKTVIAAGATGFRKVVKAKQLPAVLDAYSASIGRVFVLVAGLGVLSVFAACFVGWIDIRQRENGTDPQGANRQNQNQQDSPV